MATATEGGAIDMLEERLIDAEYKIWKKNTPYLYDFVLTHSLEWPSLTCQWLPNHRRLSSTTVEHQLLLGTHTTGEQNYIMVATCVLPVEESVVPEGDAVSKEPATAIRYDESKKEVGGYGHGAADVGKIEIKMKIKHEGEVNRARFMPQNPFIVATRGPSRNLYLWDITKHPSSPPENSAFCPQGVCIGHEKEGYAMAWSPLQEGKLLTGAEDCMVKLWDTNAAFSKDATSGTQVQAVSTFSAHTDTVEDVAWHAKDANLCGSVGDDKRLCLWDVRNADKPLQNIENAHESDINCIAFSPFKEHVLATGSADSTVVVWDTRNLKKPLSKLLGHSDQVFKVEWSPENESILGSCSADRRVGLWDLSRIGQEQSPEDAEDGPPELLFLHGGHTSKVSDFTWNTHEHWTIASVSEDNVLQVWNPAEEIYAEDIDDQEDGEEDGVVELE